MKVNKGEIYYYVFNLPELDDKNTAYAILKSNDDYNGSEGLMTTWTILDLSSNLNRIENIGLNKRISGNQLPGVAINGAKNYIFKNKKTVLTKVFGG